MTGNERIGVTFAQAEGAEPLPSQLALREISQELSAALWAVTYGSLQDCLAYSSGMYSTLVFSDPWKTVLRRWWVVRLFKNIDEWPSAEELHQFIKTTVMSRNYVKVFDFLQFVIQQQECPLGYDRNIETVLEQTRSAYRIIDSYVVPLSNEEQVKEITRALQVAQNAQPRGPRTHLKNAARDLSSGDGPERCVKAFTRSKLLQSR